MSEPPPSPQAKAEPAPLASVPSTVDSAQAPILGSLDGGPAPAALRTDRPPSADVPAPRDSAVYELVAVLRPSDVPGPPKGPEVSPAGLDAARRKTELRLTLDLAPTRARFVLDGGGFVLPEGTELRARVDRYGHFLVAPDGASYRVAEPGSLRALLGERRLDVAPLSVASLVSAGEGSKRLGRTTHKLEVVTRAATATFEIAKVADLGEGGTLLCRALLELMNAAPSTPLCGEGDVPLHAELRWTALPQESRLSGRPQAMGSIAFDALSLVRRLDVVAVVFGAPPPSARFSDALDAAPSAVLLNPQELAALRTGPVDTPAPGSHGALEAEPTLTLINSTDELRFAWLDGVPVAWVGPGASVIVHGLLRGHYTLEWRTFLGDALDPAQTIALPALSDLGGSDGGPAP